MLALGILSVLSGILVDGAVETRCVCDVAGIKGNTCYYKKLSHEVQSNKLVPKQFIVALHS